MLEAEICNLLVVSMEKQTQSLDCGRHIDLSVVVVELPNIGDVVAPTYLGKVMEVFLNFYPPPQLPNDG